MKSSLVGPCIMYVCIILQLNPSINILHNYSNKQQRFRNKNDQIEPNVQHNEEKLNNKKIYTDKIL
jgi:hypothetical protein